MLWEWYEQSSMKALLAWMHQGRFHWEGDKVAEVWGWLGSQDREKEDGPGT